MRNRMLWIAIIVATACCVLMVALPGSETVPYHMAWATFALCFGLAPWSPLATWLTIDVVHGGDWIDPRLPRRPPACSSGRRRPRSRSC